MEQVQVKKEQLSISGSTLKIIACITMFIDHIGAVIVERYLSTLSEVAYVKINIMDIVLRLIGRLGFPIFCFLLIEGFLYTRNKYKYGARLFLFALISEIPFNLAISGSIVSVRYQNVFFTLFLGFVLICLWDYYGRKIPSRIPNALANIVTLAVFCIGAEVLCTDYGAIGVLTIVIMYVERNKKVLRMVAGCLLLTVAMPVEFTSFLAAIPVKYYNGKRGLSLKYAFYIFYPAHLLLLYGISVLLGLV